jgi:hypothetical protein
MPEKDKDKNPKNVSDTDTLIQKAKFVKEAPKGEEWKKVTSDGKEVYVRRTKKETPPTETPATPLPPTKTKTKYKGPPPSNKSRPKPKPKETPKEEDFTEEVVMIEGKAPPAEKTGIFGGTQTYENIDPAKQWGADYGITTVETPDAEGRFSNTSRKYNLDKEGREVVYDKANPLKNFKDGKFVPTYTGRTIEDIRKEYETQQIETPAISGVNKANPNYKGSLMMPGTKATRIAGGGGGEFNQMNVGEIPGALSTAPVGYIEQKYDTQGNPITTPNVGVQMNTKNINPLIEKEMKVGKMYDIPSEEPVLIPGKFAKGGSVKAPKMKKYANGTNPDGTPSSPANQNNTQGSIQPGTVQIGGGQGQYGVAGNATTATGDTSAQTGDTKTQEDISKQAKQDKASKASKQIGGYLMTAGNQMYNKPRDFSASEKESQNAQSLNTTVDTVANAIPVVGAWYGAAMGASKMGRSMLKTDKYGQPISGTDAALNELMTPTHEHALDAAAKGDAAGTVREITGVGKIGRAITQFAGEGDTRTGFWGDVNKALGTNEKSDAAKKFMDEQLAKAKSEDAAYKQQQLIANRNAGNLEGAQPQGLYDLSNPEYDENRQLILKPGYAKGGVIGAAKMMYAKGGTIKGKGGPKEDAILTKANDKGIAPGSFIVPAENNDKAKGIRAALFGNGNKKAEFKKEGGETKADVAVSNGEHLFTPKERKKIINYLGEEILEELAPDAEENNEEKEMNMGGMLGNMTDRTNMREYVKGGLTKSKAKIMLHEGMANGKPITEQQRKYFGWVAGGSKESKMDGGDIHGYAMGTDVEGVEDVPVSNKTYAELITPPYSWKGSKEAYKAAADKAIKEGKVVPKEGVTAVATTKSVKAPSAKGGKKVPESARFVPKMADESGGEDVIVPGSPKYESDESIIGPDPFSEEEKRKREKASLARVSDSTAPTSPSAPRKGLGDYVGNIDPTSIAAMMQIAGGKKLLAKGSRPTDVSKIDPTWNAAVERAQREAAFGYTPEQAVLLEQQRINALNDARFAGRNLAGGSASTAFQQERQAINQGWSNALQLKSSDQQLRMEKQQYADQAVRDRAAFLDSQRRRAFGDAMDTYNVNQESGSALVGAGVRNAIGAYRYQKELDAQEKAAKVAGAPVYKV